MKWVTDEEDGSSFEIPRKAADIIPYSAVKISTLPASETATVKDACSKLRLTWEDSPDAHGADIVAYRLQQWEAAATHEVQSITTPAGAADLDGTFTITGETTDHPIKDISANDMTAALEGLATIQAVEVLRSDVANGHKWLITFIHDIGDLPHAPTADSSFLTGTTPAITIDDAVRLAQITTTLSR